MTWPGALVPLPAREPSGVLDQAQDLPVTWSTDTIHLAQVGVAGTITEPADVQWFHFALDRPAAVTLATFSAEEGTVLGLYNSDPANNSDPYDPLGHRLLVQADGNAAGDAPSAVLQRSLAAGDYYVAVSGAGNRYFHPYVADSGYPGSTGAYRLLMSAADLQLATGDPPTVLAVDTVADPAAGADLTWSPLSVRLDLSGPLNPSAISQLDVQVTAVGPGTVSQDLVAGYHFSGAANELQVQLARPLGPGTYAVSLGATSGNGLPVLAHDFTATFVVTGVEGNTGSGAAPDNTPATAHSLDLPEGVPVQAWGVMGDDPTQAAFAANDVNVYHFQINGTDSHALVAEVFAGRIGSPLDPALSLFQRVGDQLDLVAQNDDTYNATLASPQSPVANPLQNDPVLYAGLKAGDYYLVVSAHGNFPNPLGAPLAFSPDADLGQSFTGAAVQAGDYVLNVQLQTDDEVPCVVDISGLGSEQVDGPPVEFAVKFSEPVNLPQLAQQTFLAHGSSLDAVYVENAADGTRYYPHLASYDDATNTATFLLVNRLTPGDYRLHLSGSDPTGGITDLGGNPLAGNEPAGLGSDFGFNFSINGTGPGLNITEGPNDAQYPQDLGLLAPFDLNDGITVTGAFATNTADYYEFQVSQDRTFRLRLSNDTPAQGPPAGIWLGVTDTTTNQQVYLFLQGAGTSLTSQVNSTGQIVVIAALHPGTTYIACITAWPTAAGYQLQIANDGSDAEQPPPLTIGAAPAIRIRLLSASGTLSGGPAASPAAPQAGPLAATAGAGSGVTPLTSASAPAAVPNIVLANKDTAASPTVTLPPVANAVPTGVFVALGNGPAGGTGSPAGTNASSPRDVYDRVYAVGPALALSERMIGLAILSQIGTAANGDSAEPALTLSAGNQSLPAWWQTWQRMMGLDALSQFARDALAVDVWPAGEPQVATLPEEMEDEELQFDEPAALAPEPARAWDAIESTGTDLVLDTSAGDCVGPGCLSPAIAVSAFFAFWGNREEKRRLAPRIAARAAAAISMDPWPLAS
jgi:hypothetical protein